jgi:uracil-DNA glycosylase
MESLEKTNSELWEDNVPLLKEGRHKEIIRKAYEVTAPGTKVFPLRENVFAAMRITGFKDVKVVIIGQDPYFNEHEEKGPEAHGLCFSVKEGIPIPPSLRNILLEVNNSIYGGEKLSVGSDLTRWAEQGVLLLNASLTVIKKKPNSHSGLGWHAITDSIIETIAQHKTNVVFMLWGAFAQKKQALIDPAKHCVLATSHPSPLSAHRGYLGSNIFAKCNDYLKANKKPEIIW